MNERRRGKRDFLQNITIVVLTVSAVLLFASTQIASVGTGFLPMLSGGEAAGNSQANQGTAALSAPVRVAVSGPFGRYGSVTLTTASEAFEPLRGLLGQALRDNRTYSSGDQAGFLEALTGTSVYYDFLSSLPLSVLEGILQSGGETEPLPLSARRLLLAERDGGVVLYLWDEAGGGVYRCNTGLSPDLLEETVGRYELGGATFAFESTNPNAASVAPCSLFLGTLPDLPNLSVSVPLSDTGVLLSRLGFNPNTQNRYLDAGGAEVVIEQGRSLRIRPDGAIIYQSSGESAISITADGEMPDPWEAVTEVGALLNRLVSASAGDAALYLERIRQVGGATVLEFGYQASGVPIRFTDGESAAKVTLSGTQVTSMTLRVRQYTSAGESALLLPLRQALAIAVREEGAELSLGYTDSGDGTAVAKWLAE